ncbi:MAG: hypothetical protein ACSHW4_04270 [Cellulophaga sp.]
MNNIITYIKPVSILKRIFGALLILLSIYVVLFNNILFVFFMCALGIFLSATTGSQINLSNNTYREIWSIFSIHFGNWHKNPEFEYISVFKGKQSQRINSLGASASFSNQIFIINLFYSKNKHITFYQSKNKDNAFKVATDIKNTLKLDILDATEKEQKWLP